jgi:hypothetical protein
MNIFPFHAALLRPLEVRFTASGDRRAGAGRRTCSRRVYSDRQSDGIASAACRQSHAIRADGNLLAKISCPSLP